MINQARREWVGRVRGRLFWAAAALVFFLLLAAARTGYIQVVKGDHYARKALSGETDGVSLEDYPRGMILDRHLRPLAGSYSANRVLVFPELLEDPEAVARGLSAITGAGLPEAKSLLAGKRPVVLPFNLSAGQLDQVRGAGWSGVLVAPCSFRYGPRPLAAHVVGRLGKIRDLTELEELNRPGKKTYQLSDWVGRQGLEYFYEGDLKGLYPSGYAGVFTDALGKPLPGKPVLVDTRLGDFTRSDVVTTIDAGIQEAVERVMDRRVKKGAVVVMDRRTGDILAMASRPDCNPDPAREDQGPAAGDERFVNQALSLFQPGSVFKVVVAAAALSEGAARPDSRFFCRGSKDQPVRCWNEEGHGSITLAEAFAQSCNPVFVRLGRDLGPERLIACARSLGLDNQGIAGYPAAADRRQNLDLIAGRYNLANSSIGQGPVLVSPVQATAMINTVANGGIYLPPGLVREVRPARGDPRKIGPGEPVRALTPEVARQLAGMMEMVTRRGVGQKAWVDRGGSAGKSGSAQLGHRNEGINAWFSGYGPLDGPAYTVTVLVREGVSGGESAAPVFREIMEALLAGEGGVTRP